MNKLRCGYISLHPYIGIQRYFCGDTMITDLNLAFCSEKVEDKMIQPTFPRKVRNFNGNIEGLFSHSDFIFIDYNNINPDMWKMSYEEFEDLVDILSYRYNIPVIGFSTRRFSRLEHDREGSKRLAKASGLSIPDFAVASSFEELVFLVKRFDKAVVKSEGDDIDIESVIVSSWEISYIEKHDPFQWKKEIFDENGEALVEQFIEGMQFNLGLYWNRDHFIDTIFLGAEIKEAYPFDIGGVQTGEVASVSLPVRRKDLNPDVQKIISLLESNLRDYPDSHFYRGLLDVNTILTNDGQLYFLEFTPRVGVPSPDFNLIGHYDLPSRFYLSLIDDNIIPTFHNKGVNLSVCLFIYGLPYKVREFEPEQGKPSKEGIVMFSKPIPMRFLSLLFCAYPTLNEHNRAVALKHFYSDRICIITGSPTEIGEFLEGIRGLNIVFRYDVLYSWKKYFNLELIKKFILK